MIDFEDETCKGRAPAALSMDLNADLGEGCPNDEALLRLVTSASVCCGAHAGSPEAIRRTLVAAGERGTLVGAHPGYPDREGFGRRPGFVAPGEILELIVGQVETLRSMAAAIGCPVRFLKPHGALYNEAQREESVARAVLAAARATGLPLLGQPGTILAALAQEEGVRFVREGFPDRRARADGSLVPRTEAGAVLHDPADIESQVIALVEGGRVATLCIHGDEPAAVRNAELVRAVLVRRGLILGGFLS